MLVGEVLELRYESVSVFPSRNTGIGRVWERVVVRLLKVFVLCYGTAALDLELIRSSQKWRFGLMDGCVCMPYLLMGKSELVLQHSLPIS